MTLCQLFGSAILAAGLLHGQATPVELQPGKPIDLRPVLSKHVPDFGHIHAFSATGDTLHLLVRPRSVGIGPFTVVRMDLAGNVKQAVPIHVMLEPQWLLTDERTGEDFVWKRAHPTRPDPKEIIYRVTADGRVEEAVTFDRRIQMPARLGSTIWGLSNFQCRPATDPAALSPCNLSDGDPSSRALTYKPFSETELVSIEPFIPALIRMNPANVHGQSRRIMAPEILHAHTQSRRNPATMLILPSYTVAQGSVWAVAMAQPLAKGAAVLRLNAEGEVQESLRCELAKDEAFVNPHNPEGFMSPSMIGITSGKLYILDGRGMLSVCALSPRT